MVLLILFATLGEYGDGVEECDSDQEDTGIPGNVDQGTSGSYSVDMHHNNGRVIMKLKKF